MDELVVSSSDDADPYLTLQLSDYASCLGPQSSASGSAHYNALREAESKIETSILPSSQGFIGEPSPKTSATGFPRSSAAVHSASLTSLARAAPIRSR
jgi:hypothetical protein